MKYVPFLSSCKWFLTEESHWGLTKIGMIFLGTAVCTKKGRFSAVRKIWVPLTAPSAVPRAGGFGLVWIKAAFPEDGKDVFCSKALLSVKGRRKEERN